MKFLVDRCAGHVLAAWLRSEGHDVTEARELGHDPGDRELLRIAAGQGRVLITLDKDFGRIVFLEGARHGGVVRLPDVPAAERVSLLKQLLRIHRADLEEGSVITLRGNRIRVSRDS